MSASFIIGGVITSIAVAAVSATAAYQYSSQSEYAQVLSAKPAMQSMAVSREECRDEVVIHKRDSKDSNQTTERVCTTVQDSKMQQVGYDITYQLDGHEQELHIDYIPGSRIPVADGQLVLRD